MNTFEAHAKINILCNKFSSKRFLGLLIHENILITKAVNLRYWYLLPNSYSWSSIYSFVELLINCQPF